MWAILITDRRELGQPLQALRLSGCRTRVVSRLAQASSYETREQAEAELAGRRPPPWLLMTPVEIRPGERWG